MLFHLFAFSIIAAFVSFLSGYLCEKNAMEDLADLFFIGGTFFQLTAYISALLAFSLHVLKAVISNIRHYFSKTETVKRKVLFSQIKRMHLEQRHRIEKLQLHYRNELRRKRLYRLNNQKHIRLLLKSIEQSLASMRSHIPGPAYKSFKKALHKNYRMKNIEGLIKLQLEILSNR